IAASQVWHLNMNVDSPLLHGLPMRTAVGTTRCPSINIYYLRMIRLIEALLQIGKLVSNWRVRHLREAILTKVGIGGDRYCLNQLSYSLYRLRANGLSPHKAKRQTRRLTERGAKVGFSFIIFQTTLRLQRRELSSSSSVATSRLSNELESAFHKSDF